MSHPSPRPTGTPAPWPFEDSPRVAVFTTTYVLRQGHPILNAFHDEDGTWQFHWGGPFSTREALIVALEEILKHDPSVAELADLPEGWRAVRTAHGQPWVRSQQPEEEDEAGEREAN